MRDSPVCSKCPRFSAAALRPDYASFVWAACPSALDTTASSLALLRDRARFRPLTPVPRRDIAKPLASCRSETQRTAPSQERVSFYAFCCRKILIEKQGHTKSLRLIYPSRHKNRCFRKEGGRE